MKRKEVKQVLDRLGVSNRFTLRTVGFCRETRKVLTIKDWHPDPKANEIKEAFRGTGVIVDFDPAEGVTFVSC